MYFSLFFIFSVLPKAGCIFEFLMDAEKEKYKIKIFGDNFRYRTHDRSKSKLFKRKDIIDL
jgi:RNase P/RNase MRP subunit p29